MSHSPTPSAPTSFPLPYRDAMPEHAWSMVEVEPLTNPRLAAWNTELAHELGLQWDNETRIEKLGGARQQLMATIYSGHQFGHYVPQLGDGRAASLGVINKQELQLKGSGRTPYSRFGDGKAVWRSSIREYLASEALHALGIPTTRALALVVGDNWVERETMEHAAIVTRVAPCFIRFGHFEYFYYRQDEEGLRALADYVITQHFPEHADQENRYAKLYYNAVKTTAEMLASWMAVGFCHGVMNTDNMSILGLTIDYGPYGFMETYRHDYICNHSDNTGRYAYDQQPRIAQWNLKQLAIALSPLVPVEQLQTMLNMFTHYFVRSYATKMRAKLGLNTQEDADNQLNAEFLELVEQAQADYTQSFRKLATFQMDGENTELAAFFNKAPQAWTAWEQRYKQRLFREHSKDSARRKTMTAANPALILRNGLAQDVIEAAEKGELSQVDATRKLLTDPFDSQLDSHPAAQPNPEKAAEICVSCSS